MKLTDFYLELTELESNEYAKMNTTIMQPGGTSISLVVIRAGFAVCLQPPIPVSHECRCWETSGMAQVTGSFPPGGRPGLDFWLWSSFGSCDHLRSRLVDGILLSLAPSQEKKGLKCGLVSLC